MGKNEIILFGCGTLGHEALHFLGKENVACFCDNNVTAVSHYEDEEKRVISFEKLKKKHKNSTVILCVVDVNFIYDIARQCEENEIYDYIPYEAVRRVVQDREAFLNYINSPANRMLVRKKLWSNRIQMLEIQVNFFKNHADIRHLKPAKGQLRNRQINCVRAAKECLEKISELEISPFLIGGNLIGYVRHGGFVPWDDDIDFGLIRDDYEKLKEYCKKNLYTREEFDQKEKRVERNDIADGMEECWWVCYPGNFVISYKGISIDFFSFDYYDEDFSFDNMRIIADEIRKNLKTIIPIEKKLQYLATVREKNLLRTTKKSNHIYFGIDSTEIEHQFHRGRYIPTEVIFPLRRAEWEGEYFWVPNDAEELLNYEFENIWEFPHDAGMPKHFSSLGIVEDIG